MADALVSIVLEKLGSIVLDGIEEEVKLLVGVKMEIKSLIGTLTIIQGVLEDAEEKQVKNEAVKLWLENFKEISYDADDILDEWRTRSLIPHMQQFDPVIKKNVQSKLFNLFSCSCFKPVFIRHEIGIKIRELNERLVGIVEKKQLYNLDKIRSNGVRRIPSIAVPDVPIIYGRDDEKNILINKLLSESSTVNLHVPIISIVGTGGFGKTTLAQLILKEEKVIASFDNLIMWVCVSDPFLVENIAKEIIQHAKGIVPDTIGWQALHKNLSECVKGRRFILVLDDVWSCSSKEWSQLKNALDCGATGSRIIVTSRSERLAKMIKSSYIHQLGQLSDDDCWSLFKCIAFSGRENDIDTYEDIGIKISKKCKGVPLAARVIASLMCLKTTKQEWRDVLASNIWDVEEEGEGFLPSILLSYYALPSYLKPCLLYFAVFPKDAIIGKKEMVQLWMSQGYLGSDDDRSAELEMKGRGYFDNLAMLSFLQDFEKDDEGNITTCKMHDLVHDFVQFLTKNETIILGEEKVCSVKVRHLCGGDLDLSSICEQKNLRTLRIHLKKNNTLALELLHQLTCLRALSLCRCGIKELPSEVERLLHLRYLDLSNNDELVELPETVCNLFNLQTLNLSSCSMLMRLPKDMAKLSSSLRHLHNNGCINLKYMPVGVGKLRWLRTMEEFIVGGCDKESKENGCTFGELRLLNHLEGSLTIIVVGEVAFDASNVAQAELNMKEKLRSLELVFRREDVDDQMRIDGILKSLQPHTNLEKLMIRFNQGFRLPDWILTLSNLTQLILCKLDQCLLLPVLWKLASLEVLDLRGLEFYGVDESHDIHNRSSSEQAAIFPKLKKLKLSEMRSLEKWNLPLQNRVDLFPNLQELNMKACGLYALPGLGNLKSLETLYLSDMNGFLSFHEFFLESSMSDDRSGGEVVFPVLKYLNLSRLRNWEEKEVDRLRKKKEEKVCNTNNGITIMPRLNKLEIISCPKLKVIPFYMFSHELKDLEIYNCPQLTGLQPSLPPLLEKLRLSYDVGVLKSSLLPLLHNNNDNYPNLNHIQISDSSQSSLPQGFKLLTSIRELTFYHCKILDFGPDDLKHLSKLNYLEIYDTPILVERFRGGGEISSSSSHGYRVISPLIMPNLDPINVHSDIECDNCEMSPIVGKRYRCKECHDETEFGFDLCEKCYNTPSKHTDFVNQHQRQGHTFELIANRGDSPVPVHPDDASTEIEDHTFGLIANRGDRPILVHPEEASEDAEGGLVVAKSIEIEEQIELAQF